MTIALLAIGGLVAYKIFSSLSRTATAIDNAPINAINAVGQGIQGIWNGASDSVSRAINSVENSASSIYGGTTDWLGNQIYDKFYDEPAQSYDAPQSYQNIPQPSSSDDSAFAYDGLDDGPG